MKIRKATKKDFRKIIELIKIEYKKHYNEKWTDKNTLKTLNFYSKTAHIFVAEEKEIVGFVIIREEQYNDNKSLKVEELIVSGKHQGNGIGRQLMEFVKNYCQKKKTTFIWLITSKKAPAFKFYNKIGYKQDKDAAYFFKELKIKKNKK